MLKCHWLLKAYNKFASSSHDKIRLLWNVCIFGFSFASGIGLCRKSLEPSLLNTCQNQTMSIRVYHGYPLVFASWKRPHFPGLLPFGTKWSHASQAKPRWDPYPSRLQSQHPCKAHHGDTARHIESSPTWAQVTASWLQRHMRGDTMIQESTLEVPVSKMEQEYKISRPGLKYSSGISGIHDFTFLGGGLSHFGALGIVFQSKKVQGSCHWSTRALDKGHVYVASMTQYSAAWRQEVLITKILWLN